MAKKKKLSQKMKAALELARKAVRMSATSTSYAGRYSSDTAFYAEKHVYLGSAQGRTMEALRARGLVRTVEGSHKRHVDYAHRGYEPCYTSYWQFELTEEGRNTLL